MKRLKTLAMIIACSSVLNIANAELQTNRAVINQATQRVSAFANFTAPAKGDLYLATQINGTLLFFSGTGGISTTVSPFSQDKEFSGKIPLFDFAAEGITPGRYPLYQVVTHPGTNPLDFNNWIGGLGGLSIINFTIGLPTAETGDFNNDGFSDDDHNRDGFHDDDLDKNGYHDDDQNRDGFHDDDLDKNGSSDTKTPPVTSNDPNIAEGKKTYGSCASSSCHGQNPAANQNNILKARDPNVIINAIKKNKGGMGFLAATITGDAANKITAYLNSVTTSSSVANSEKNEQGESNDNKKNEQGESNNNEKNEQGESNDNEKNEQGESHDNKNHESHDNEKNEQDNN